MSWSTEIKLLQTGRVLVRLILGSWCSLTGIILLLWPGSEATSNGARSTWVTVRLQFSLQFLLTLLVIMSATIEGPTATPRYYITVMSVGFQGAIDYVPMMSRGGSLSRGSPPARCGNSRRGSYDVLPIPSKSSRYEAVTDVAFVAESDGLNSRTTQGYNISNGSEC